MNHEMILRQRIRWLTGLFMVGLIFSGLTAIPLETEIDWLARLLGIADLKPEQAASGFSQWLLKVREGLHDTNARHPFIFYGMDWLAFGHVVIAIAFLGALRNPVRNIWLFDFGIIACALIVPWAFVFGHVRGIPVGWRLIDCSFGIFGVIPVWLCRRWARELENSQTKDHKERPFLEI